jgi:cell division protein ZapA
MSAPDRAKDAEMSQVSVTINGRQYRMACEDGQENHLVGLARELDGRIQGLRTKFGEIGDARLTVMAALTVVDELAEMTLRVKQMEQDLAAAQQAHRAADEEHRMAQAVAAAALGTAAERIETIAKKLNDGIAASDVALG